jgi:hypothetical protein
MQWNTSFWYTSVQPPPAAPSSQSQSETIATSKEAKHRDICFGQESDIEIMDELGNEFDDQEANALNIVKMISDDSTGSTRCEGQFSETVCDFSPLLSFSFQDSWNSTTSKDSCILDDYRCTEDLGEDMGQSGQSGSDGPKHQQLRLVDGRLQVVGFNADCHDRTTSRTTKLRRSHHKRRNAPKPFWSELMYYLSK